MTILLDPGHGGRATGATWPSTGIPYLVEKHLNLETALHAEAVLAGVHKQPVALTRRDDSPMTLGVRGGIARVHKPKLVVSIHYNSYVTDELHGGLLFVQSGDIMGKTLALAIKKVTGFRIKIAKPNGWKQRAWNVLDVFDPFPRVLVEGAYLSNPEDRALIQRGLPKTLGEAIAAACYTVAAK